MNVIWSWLVKLLKMPWGQSPAARTIRPTREEIALLPWFESLCLEDIVVIETHEGARRAYNELTRAKVVGFDTESKPTFVKGESSDGPHVAQFATPKRAYIFPLHDASVRKMAGALMELPGLKKVGFGLHDDLRRIRSKLRVQPEAVLDLETLFRERGHGRGVGVKMAVALVFKRRFKKSKKAATSNWKNRHLSDQQILYAANDAYAAIRVYDVLMSTAPPTKHRRD